MRTPATKKTNNISGVEYELDESLAVVATSSGSPQSLGPFGDADRLYVCAIGNAIWLAHGASPTAVSTGKSQLIPVNTPVIVVIAPGDLVSVLQITGAATVSVVPAKVYA